MTAMRSVVGTIVLALVLPVGLAGCAQPDPLGQPTYACTPDDGTSPYPCYQTQHDQKIKEDALYTEAETVYRKFFAEEERIYRTGGVAQPTPVLLETTTGQYLAGSMAIYTDLAARHSKVQSGDFDIAWIRRDPADAAGGATVTMQACSDASRVWIGPSPREAKPGRTVKETAFFAGDAGQLKLFSSITQVVATCS